MKTFLFRTDTTMKPHNRGKWWIDRDIIPEVKIDAVNLKEALKIYTEYASDHGINISKNALQLKQPMFRDTKTGTTEQVGYVITGSSDFRDDDTGKWSKQYVDLWVGIDGIIKVFDEINS